MSNLDEVSSLSDHQGSGSNPGQSLAALPTHRVLAQFVAEVASRQAEGVLQLPPARLPTKSIARVHQTSFQLCESVAKVDLVGKLGRELLNVEFL